VVFDQNVNPSAFGSDGCLGGLIGSASRDCGRVDLVLNFDGLPVGGFLCESELIVASPPKSIVDVTRHSLNTDGGQGLAGYAALIRSTLESWDQSKPSRHSTM
jgi:hypothetical protein